MASCRRRERHATYRQDGGDNGDFTDGAASQVGHEVLFELLVAGRRVRHGDEAAILVGIVGNRR